MSQPDNFMRDLISFVRDATPELQSEAMQRESSGNDEDWQGIRALADRGEALLQRMRDARAMTVSFEAPPMPFDGPWRWQDFGTGFALVTDHSGAKVVLIGATAMDTRGTDGLLEPINPDQHPHIAALALVPEMARQLQLSHRAIDILLAGVISADKTFMPTRSPVWPLIESSFRLLQRLRLVQA